MRNRLDTPVNKAGRSASASTPRARKRKNDAEKLEAFLASRPGVCWKIANRAVVALLAKYGDVILEHEPYDSAADYLEVVQEAIMCSGIQPLVRRLQRERKKREEKKDG